MSTALGNCNESSAFLRDLAIEQRSVSTLKTNPRNAPHAFEAAGQGDRRKHSGIRVHVAGPD